MTLKAFTAMTPLFKTFLQNGWQPEAGVLYFSGEEAPKASKDAKIQVFFRTQPGRSASGFNGVEMVVQADVHVLREEDPEPTLNQLAALLDTQVIQLEPGNLAQQEKRPMVIESDLSPTYRGYKLIQVEFLFRVNYQEGP